jgi:NAD(P)-dependent dehydrogenase (short-subunit alcohol dehydrogenase family)
MSFIESLFSVKNKVFVLTGGGGVLAGAIGEGVAKAGAKVALLDIRIENAQKRVDIIKQNGGIAFAYETNVLDINALEKTRDQINKEMGPIDVLINLAGGNMPGASILPNQTIFDLKKDDFEKVMNLNINGTVYPTIVFSKDMAQSKKGCIINISSMTAYRAISRQLGYSAAKAAVSNFTRYMAMEMGLKFGEGIRVNALAPGFFIGDQNRALLINEDGSYTDRGKTVIASTPLQRFGEADELIGAVIYLTSDASKFVTGVVLPIDGGFESYSGV